MHDNYTVVALERWEYCGDWHDAPIRWAVCASGAVVQKFSTKREAFRFRTRLRRAGGDVSKAISAFCA